MAQDFYARSGVGPDDKHITTVDEGGRASRPFRPQPEIGREDAEIRKLKRPNDLLEHALIKWKPLSDSSPAENEPG